MSAARDAQVIEKLKANYEQTAYYPELMSHEDDVLETQDQITLSVIIPARNEFPNIVSTVHSILNCWDADGFDPKDIEIIIVNNCSTDYNDPKYDYSKPGDRGTTEHLMPRGIYHSRILRVLYDPIAGNHSARNKGARIARGKYLFFSDAHMSYAPGTFKHGLQACQESGGIVHIAVAWMGGHAPGLYKTPGEAQNSIMTQYTMKLGDGDFRGTWANYRPWSDRWFYIAAQGHCSLFVDRKQFLDFRGYPDVHRTYGGGEVYMNMKWWMFGSSVAVEPRAIGYHLASSRGYEYTSDDYKHNQLNVLWALGVDALFERSYINYLRNGRKEVLDRMVAEAKIEMADDRKYIEQRRLTNLYDLLVDKPWDKKNVERGGASNSSMLVYHNTWKMLLNESRLNSRKVYLDSKLQPELEKYFEERLGKYIYKNSEYGPVVVNP